MTKILYGSTIFLSAFLLFFIQPLIAKAMLPYFGGSGFVWISTILFFQIALLLGYGYAYFLAKYFRQGTQAAIHLVFLCGSLVFIPIYLHSPASVEGLWSVWAVLLLLTKSILIPCIIISASSPLLQHWYCHLHKTTFPYVFYSISNAGSLIGLLGYPFLLEPLIGLKVQRLGWSIGYGVYVLLCLFCLRKLLGEQPEQGSLTKDGYSLSVASCLKWLLFTFLSSALLLSTTQFLVQNVINLPLLWVIPLALYLISYIVIFSNPKSYNREFWSTSFMVWLILFLWLLYHAQLGGINVVIVILAMLYSACMICHGELIKIKPHSQDLTLFYLVIAFGGVLGGIFSNIVALFLFVNWWDLFVPLLVINVLVIISLTHQYLLSKRRWDLALNVLSVFLLAGMIYAIYMNIYNPKKEIITQYRNPYGVIKVFDSSSSDALSYRAIMHGMVVHGFQFKDAKKAKQATTYYGHHSGIGVAFDFLRENHRSLNVGIVGLGCGVIATYGKKGDNFTFYEIDPDVEKVARNDFSFISQSEASIRIFVGDARLVLQNHVPKSDAQKYDLLIVDAFNGDSIPSHLLTSDAMMIYQQHLAKNGLLAIHISNTYLDLLPVTKGLAQNSGCAHYLIQSKNDPNNGLFDATWTLITCEPSFENWLVHHGIKAQATEKVKPRLWTDDENTILPLLKWQG